MIIKEERNSLFKIVLNYNKEFNLDINDLEVRVETESDNGLQRRLTDEINELCYRFFI